MSKLMDFLPFALKNLFSKPATLNYPAEPINFPERSRGHIEVDIDSCVLCGSCQRRCPSGAITVDRNEHFWSIDRLGCVQCGYCVDNCPKNCLKIVPGYTEPSTEKTVDKVIKDPSQMPQKKAPAKKDDSAVVEGVVNNTEQCVFCGKCGRDCPADAISVDRTAKSWNFNAEECLQCGACIEGCPKKCLSFGEVKVEASADTDTVEGVVNNTEQCVFCGKCGRDCPADAISVDRTAKSWNFNAEECLQCGACIEGCPKKCLAFGEVKAENEVHEVDTADTVAEQEEEVFTLPTKEEQSGPVVNDFDKCIFCGLCAKTCPAGALAVDRKTKMWSFNPEYCVMCFQCLGACPKKSLSYSSAYVDGEIKLVNTAPVKKSQPAKTKKDSKPARKLSQDEQTGPIVNDFNKCIYCTLCARNCPAGAIFADRKEKVWKFDAERCVECTQCVYACPKGSLKIKD